MSLLGQTKKLQGPKLATKKTPKKGQKTADPNYAVAKDEIASATRAGWSIGRKVAPSAISVTTGAAGFGGEPLRRTDREEAVSRSPGERSSGLPPPEELRRLFGVAPVHPRR